MQINEKLLQTLAIMNLKYLTHSSSTQKLLKLLFPHSRLLCVLFLLLHVWQEKVVQLLSDLV